MTNRTGQISGVVELPRCPEYRPLAIPVEIEFVKFDLKSTHYLKQINDNKNVAEEK